MGAAVASIDWVQFDDSDDDAPPTAEALVATALLGSRRGRHHRGCAFADVLAVAQAAVAAFELLAAAHGGCPPLGPCA